VIRQARVLDPAAETDMVADVLIRDSCVSEIGKDIGSAPGLPEIQVPDAWLFPGLIDMHVHLRVPGDIESETLESGLRAAVAGGFTTVAMMPNTTPALDSSELMVQILQDSIRTGLADVIPVPCITRGRLGGELVDFERMHSGGAIAFTDDGSPLGDMGLLAEALRAVDRFGGLIIEHPEDLSLSNGGSVDTAAAAVTGAAGIPESAEYEYVRRCLEVLRDTGSRLHLTHLSSPVSVELVAEAAAEGNRVTCDVTPHHIALNHGALLEHGTLAKMNPPLRCEESRRRLVNLVAAGSVDAIASDHAPHHLSRTEGNLDKAAFGITGLETALPLALQVLGREGGMSPLEILRLFTTGPAAVLGMESPSLDPGDSRTFVLFDSTREYTLADAGTFSLSSNSPFLNRQLRGRVVSVWKNGLVYREGSFEL
jgi:dihydroorotase